MSADPGRARARSWLGPLGGIRARLTAWFLLAMAVLVAAGSTATYLVVRDRLLSDASADALALARAAAAAEDPEEIALNSLAAPGDQVWVIAPSGQVIARTSGAPGATRADVMATLERVPAGDDATYTSATATGNGGMQVVVLHRASGVGSTLRTLRLALVAVGLIGLAVSAVIGAILAARALRPVDQMREEVDDISGTSLDRRLPPGRPDELGRLAAAFNRLLERAEVAAREQESFVADASHEMKTPITALEGHARLVVRAIDRGDLPRARESADVALEQTRRLALLLRELLALAGAGALSPEALSPVRLDAAVSEACSEVAALEPDRVLDLDLQEATVAGEHGRLRELALILVNNAVRYSPPEAPVSVRVTGGPRPSLVVTDRGPGLTAEDLDRAFDRFFRGSASAGRPGSGLGLPIARAICERLGAEVRLESGPGGGARAVVTFTAPA